MLHSSLRRFSMGVPVRANRWRLRSALTALAFWVA